VEFILYLPVVAAEVVSLEVKQVEQVEPAVEVEQMEAAVEQVELELQIKDMMVVQHLHIQQHLTGHLVEVEQVQLVELK
jgi:hypothetical protein